MTFPWSWLPFSWAIDILSREAQKEQFCLPHLSSKERWKGRKRWQECWQNPSKGRENVTAFQGRKNLPEITLSVHQSRSVKGTSSPVFASLQDSPSPFLSLSYNVHFCFALVLCSFCHPFLCNTVEASSSLNRTCAYAFHFLKKIYSPTPFTVRHPA